MAKKASGARTKLDLDRVLTRILELMVQHPVSTLTFSKVARLSKVPRSTLYYYFGSDRNAMIREAVKFGMSAFAQLLGFEKDQKLSNWQEFQQARISAAIEMVRRFPWAPGLYFRFRSDPSKLGETIREVEDQYLKRFVSAWKRYGVTGDQKPDPMALRASAYIKLGLLWGIAADSDQWFADSQTAAREKIVKKITAAVDLFLKN